MPIQAAGALADLSRDQAYHAADHGTMPTIETSPHRRMVPTAKWLQVLGLAQPTEQAPATDVDAIANAVVDRLLDRLATSLGGARGAPRAAAASVREGTPDDTDGASLRLA